jgi:hypothetical protein
MSSLFTLLHSSKLLELSGVSEVKFLFEPHSVVLIGSSKIREKVGMASPWLFENVIYNMNKFFRGKTFWFIGD